MSLSYHSREIRLHSKWQKIRGDVVFVIWMGYSNMYYFLEIVKGRLRSCLQKLLLSRKTPKDH